MTQGPDRRWWASRLREMLATGGADGAVRMAQLVLFGCAGWLLGPAMLAVITVGWAIGAVAANFGTGGPELAGVRTVAGSAAAAHGAITRRVTGQKLLLLLLLAPGTLLVAAFWPGAEPGLLPQLTAQLAALAAAAWSATWVLRAAGDLPGYAASRFVQALVMLGAGVAGLLGFGSPLVVPLAEALGLLAGGLVAWRRLPRADQPEAAPPEAALGLRLADAIRLGAAGLLSSLIAPMVLAASAIMLAPAAFAAFAGALRLVTGLLNLMQMFLQGLLPFLAREAAVSSLPPLRMLVRLALVTGVLGGLAAVLLFAAAPWLAPALLGPDMAGAVAPFRNLLPLLPLIALSSPASYALIAAGRTGAALALQCCGTAVTAVGCVAAIALDAAGGAVLALMLGVAVQMAATWWLIGRRIL